MLSKEVSSTIFKIFGLMWPGFETRSPGPLANTLPTRPILTVNKLIRLWSIKSFLWLWWIVGYCWKILRFVFDFFFSPHSLAIVRSFIKKDNPSSCLPWEALLFFSPFQATTRSSFYTNPTFPYSTTLLTQQIAIVKLLLFLARKSCKVRVCLVTSSLSFKSK